MGGASSTQQVESYMQSLVTICDTATEYCWTEFSGTNEIILDGVSNAVIHDIQQNLITKCDVSCTMDVYANTDVSEQMSQVAEAFAKNTSEGYGFNKADSDQFFQLCMSMTVQIQQNYSQNLSSYGQVNNVVMIKDSSNIEVYALYQTATYESEVKGMMSVATVNSVALDMESMIDLYAENEKSQSLALFLIAIAVIIVLVLMVFGMFSNLLFNPAFWFMLCSVGVVLSGYFVLAYMPEWWPYKKIQDSDTDSDKKAKEEDNKAELKFWLILFAIFGGIDIIFVLIALMTHKKKQAPMKQQQQMMQQQQQMMLQQQQMMGGGTSGTSGTSGTPSTPSAAAAPSSAPMTTTELATSLASQLATPAMTEQLMVAAL